MAATCTIRDDAQWIARAGRGEGAAFAALIGPYERPLYGYIYRLMGGDAEDAADLTQETFIKVYRALPRLPAGVNFPAWLYRVARNCCLDELRRRRRARRAVWDGAGALPPAPQSAGEDPERIAIAREGERDVAAVLARMSRRNREALILRECQGLSCAEIGVVLGISPKAAKSTLFRAREEFRRVASAGESAAPSARAAAQ